MTEKNLFFFVQSVLLVNGLEKTTAEPWRVILVQLFGFDYFQREADLVSSGEFAYTVIVSFTGVVLVDG